MGNQRNSLAKQIRDIHKQINCGYLSLSSGTLIQRGKTKNICLLVECHNLQCGPQHGCDFLDLGSCNYRSEKVDIQYLYLH